MGKYLINGRKKISGKIKSDGSKNSVLPILAATILNRRKSIIYNCPDILDTQNAFEILKVIGCKVEFKEHTAIIDSSNISSFEIPDYLIKKMRSSIIFLGSILSVFKNVIISYPGGCELGKRPIDLHLNALKKMGAQIFNDKEKIICFAEKLNGCEIRLKFPSVGATQNIILAAVLANGTTKIINAAREPEIIDLQNFLKKMGADINGAGTSHIIINGVKKLNKKVEHKIIPDRISIATFLISAMITNGEIEIINIIKNHLPIKYFLKVGCEIKLNKNKIFLKANKNLSPIKKLYTNPYPGFPTDLQAQFTSILSLANGQSIIKENIFEKRDKHIYELQKMGANIKILPDHSTFIINGVKNLNGAELISKDLRGGAALILGGLAANNKTIINDDKNHILRGYEKIHEKLKSLNADIKYIN